MDQPHSTPNLDDYALLSPKQTLADLLIPGGLFWAAFLSGMVAPMPSDFVGGVLLAMVGSATSAILILLLHALPSGPWLRRMFQGNLAYLLTRAGVNSVLALGLGAALLLH